MMRDETTINQKQKKMKNKGQSKYEKVRWDEMQQQERYSKKMKQTEAWGEGDKDVKRQGKQDNNQ